MQAPVAVLTANTKRETGKKAQFGNIMAAKVQDTNIQSVPLACQDSSDVTILTNDSMCRQ